MFLALVLLRLYFKSFNVHFFLLPEPKPESDYKVTTKI